MKITEPMPKICYVEQNFTAAVLADIVRANEILEEYTRQNYKLTLRGLYYQFVSRGFIANNLKEYKRLGDVIGKARLGGLIDWDHVVDETRDVEQNSHWDEPESIIESAARSYAIDKWEGQRYRPEVWLEKQALSNVIGRVCGELDIPWFCCRGYTSLSEMWTGAMRLRSYYKVQKQVPVIIHLGDHDPSGIDMSRDIMDRVSMFCGFKVRVERIALNFDQVQQYNPPPNPAKIGDSRAKSYIDKYGEESWELDALEPGVLVQLIRDAVVKLIDQDKYDAMVARQENDRQLLTSCARRWEEVIEMLGQEEGDGEEDQEKD